MNFDEHKLPEDLDHTKFPAESPAAIWVEACSKGEAALVAEKLRWESEPTFCGGSYILIKPARGQFVAWLKSQGIGQIGVYGGWEVSVPSSYHGQSQDWKDTQAKAFADCLKAHGIRAYKKTYTT